MTFLKGHYLVLIGEKRMLRIEREKPRYGLYFYLKLNFISKPKNPS